MNLAGVVVSALTSGLVASLGTNAPAGIPSEGAAIIAAASTRNDGLQSFTFRANVAMAMRHFPWLHFHVSGTGDYKRGDHYVLRLSGGLPFSSAMHEIDLSMIDPGMWSSRYRYDVTGQRAGDTLFSLQSLHDPGLTAATVALTPLGRADWVDSKYADGTHVHMTVNSNDVEGFSLPASLTADVDRPHMPLSADAKFSDYVISAAGH
jgi:hypothetical protein